MKHLAILFLVAFSGCTTFEKTEDQIFQDLDKSVFKITNPSGGGGTAFIFRGRVITAGHVCEGNTIMYLDDNGALVPSFVQRINIDFDLCEVSPQRTDFFDQGITSIAETEPRRASRLYVAGYAKLRHINFAKGRVSGFALAYVGNQAFMVNETDLVGYGGNSGSPAVNSRGQLIGVLSLGWNDTNYTSFVPVVVLRKFLL